MSVVIFDGVHLAGDTMGVTWDGLVDQTEKVMSASDGLYVGFVGSVTAARHLVHLAVTALAQRDRGMSPRFAHYANQVIELLQGKVDRYDDASIRVVDAKNNTVWYTSTVEDRVLLIGEPLKPFVMGSETTRTLVNHMFSQVTMSRALVSARNADENAVNIIHQVIELSEGKGVANKFAKYPIHCINTEDGSEQWIEGPPEVEEAEHIDMFKDGPAL